MKLLKNLVEAIQKDPNMKDDHPIKNIVDGWNIYAKREQGGGSAEQIEKAKHIRAEIDGVRKKLRHITDGLSGIKTRYEKFSLLHTNPAGVKVGDNNNDTGKYNLLRQLESEFASKGDTAQSSGVTKASTIDRKILGLDSSIKELGKALVEETERLVHDKKHELTSVLATMQEIYGDQPTNAMYQDRIAQWKAFIEGRYDVFEDSDTTNTGTNTTKTDNIDKSLGIISLLDRINSTIKTEYQTAQSMISKLAEGIREDNQNIREQARYGYERRRGYYAEAGGSDPNVVDDIKHITDNINKELQKKLLSELDLEYMRRTNPVMSSVLGSEPTLFSTIYQNYLDTKNKKSPLAAVDELSQAVEANNLVPATVLSITATDRAIFIGVTLFLRMFSLYIVEYILYKNYLKTLTIAFLWYLAIYTMFILGFIFLVNIDIYRMRILFNYANMHANTGSIILYIVAIWAVGVLMLMMIWQNTHARSQKRRIVLSTEQKAEMMYKVEVLSMLDWLGLTLLVMVV